MAPVDSPAADPLQGCSIWHAVNATLVAGMVGMWLSILLCGIGIAQACNYFSRYSEDPVWLKSLVWLVTLLNVAHSAIICASNYRFLIAAHTFEDEISPYWATPAVVATHFLIAAVVMLYFTRTCYYLLVGKKLQKPVVAVLIIPIACHLAFGIDTVVHIAHMKTMLDIEPFRMSSAVPMLSFQVAADVLVSVALCLSLPRPSLINQRTRVTVQDLVIYTVSRGIITTAAAVVELVALAAVPDSTWFIAVEYIVACLYINSFLASLNARKRLRRRLTGYTTTHHTVSSAPIPLGLRRPRKRESRGDDGGEDATVVSPNGVQADVFTIPKFDDREDCKA